MGQRNSADIIIRLALKDGGVREALKASGRDGEKALRKIDRAAKKARPSLKGVDAAAKDIKSRLLSSIKPLGAFGSGLKAIGPIGFGVAATLGIVTSALLLMARAGAQAATTIAAIGDTAEDIGLATDAYQALVFVTAQERQEQSELNSILKTASKNLGEAVLGTGEFVSKAGLLNKELVEQVANADTLADRLALVSKAYQSSGDESARVQILTATFGDSNLKLAKALVTVEGGLDGAIEKAHEYNLILSDSMIQAAQEAATQLEIADLRIDVSKQRLAIGFADTLASMKSAWADLIDFMATMQGAGPLDSFDQQIEALEIRRKKLDDRRKELFTEKNTSGFLGTYNREQIKADGREIDGINERIDKIKALKIEQEALNKQQQEQDNKVRASAALRVKFNQLIKEATTSTQKRAAAEKVLADAISSDAITVTEEQIKQIKASISVRFRDTAAIAEKAKVEREAAALLASQGRVADAIRKSLLSTTEKLTAKEAELKVLTDAGVLSKADAAKALEKYTDSLDGTDAAIAKVTAALAAAQTPQQIYEANIINLDLAQKRLNLTTEQTILLTERYAAARDKAIQAEAEAAEREKFGETLKEAQKRILETIKTSEEVIDAKIELQKKILKALGAAISDEDAAKFLKEYEEGLRKAADSSDKLNDSQRRMQSFMSQQIRSWSDLKDAALDALQSMLKQWLLNKGKMSGGLFGSGAGSSGGGGFNLGTILASFFHDGTASVSASARQGRVSAAEVATAPRYHSGKSSVGQDEQVAILQTRERIFSRSDNGSLIRAINNATNRSYAANDRSVGGVKIIINNNAAGVEVQTEDKGIDSEGMRNIELKMFRVGTAAAKKVLSDGSADAPLKNRYGIHRSARSR